MALADDLYARVNAKLAQESTPGLTPTALPVDSAFAGAAKELDEAAAIKSSIRQDLASMLPKRAAPQGDVSWADHAYSWAGSLGQLGGMAAAIPEYGARKLAGAGETPLEQGAQDVVEKFGDWRRDAYKWANEMFAKRSPEAQQRAAREVLNLDPQMTIWQGGPGEFISSLGLKISSSLAPTLGPLISYGVLQRMGLGSVASTLYGVSEGALSAGGVAAQIAQDVEEAPLDVLMESPKFRELYQAQGEQAARQSFITEVQGYTPVIAGAAVGLIAKVTGKKLDTLFGVEEGAGLLHRLGVGYTSEFAQEFAQSGAEQFAQNIARKVYDSDFDVMDQVLEQAVQGGMVGGPMGGVVAGAFGRRKEPTITNTPVPPDIAAASRPPVPPPRPRPPGPMTQQPGLPGIETEPRPPEATNPYMGQPDLGPEEPADPRAAMYGTDPEAGGQRSLFDPVPFELSAQPRPQLALPFENAAGAQRPGPGFQMVPPPSGEQLSLGLRDRSTGLEPGALITPQPMVPPAPAPEVNSPLTVNPFQEDAFPTQQPQQGFIAPTAEPVRDILAQLEDLRLAESNRQAVYLSKQNLDNIQKLGRLDSLLGVGVPIPNFDGQGGLMIAKSPQVAEELSAMRESGAGSLEEIIGMATGAGLGKPIGSNLVVQKVDKLGNVVRERIVTPQERVNVLKEFGEGARTVSVQAAMKRRADLIKQEHAEKAKDLETDKTFPTARERAQEAAQGALTQNVGEDIATLTEQKGSDEEIGQRMLRYAADVRAEERKGRKGLQEVPAPGELTFRGKELTELQRERQALMDEILALQDEEEALQTGRGRVKKASRERLKEVQAKLEDVRARAHRVSASAGGQRGASEKAAETYRELHSKLTDAATALEFAKQGGSEKQATDAEAAYNERLRALNDFIKAEGGYTRSEALAAAATRFSPKTRRAIRTRSTKQRGSEIEKAMQQAVADRNVGTADQASHFDEEASASPDKQSQSFERAQRSAKQAAQVSTDAAAARFRRSGARWLLTPRAKDLVERLFNYLSPTSQLKGAEGSAAVEINQLLRQWVSHYRMALRANMPAGMTKARNWKVDIAAARVTEMIGRLRQDVRNPHTLEQASRFVAGEIYFMLRMAGRFGVQSETDPMNFWKAVRKGPIEFRDYLRKHLAPISPDEWLELTEEQIKALPLDELNSLYVHAVETSTRERTSDGQRAEIVRQLLEANSERFSNKPYKIKGEKKERYVSARSLFREHLNEMSMPQLRELYTKGSEWAQREGRKWVKHSIPPVGQKLPPPLPLNILTRRLAPSDKIKYILRAAVRAQAQVHGGASKATTLTRKATSSQPGFEYVRREKTKKGRYNVQVLTKDSYPRDLTPKSKAEHDLALSDAKHGIDDAIGRSLATLSKISRGEYAALAEQREDGKLTDLARDMIYGRAYVGWLRQYARALQAANLQSKEGLAELKRVAKDLNRIAGMDPEELAVEMGALFRAESREQLIATIAMDREKLSSLRTPEGRREATAKNFARVRDMVAMARRFDSDLPLDEDHPTNDSWVQNSRYQEIVAPVLRKISDSILKDGWPSYNPTPDEVKAVGDQLMQWRRFAQTRKKFYRPLQAMLEDAGFFDRDTALLKQYASRVASGDLVEFANQPPQRVQIKVGKDSYGKQDTSIQPEGASREPVVEPYSTANVWKTFGRAETRAPRSVESQEALLRAVQLRKVNQLIRGFKNLASKTSARTQDIIEAETRMVVELQKLKAWRYTGGEKAQLGTIGLPAFEKELAGLYKQRSDQQRKIDKARRDGRMDKATELGAELNDTIRQIRRFEKLKNSLPAKPITYRRISRRLREGEITKDQARAAIDRQLREFKAPILQRWEKREGPRMAAQPRLKEERGLGNAATARAIADEIAYSNTTTFGRLITAVYENMDPADPRMPIVRAMKAQVGLHNVQAIGARGMVDNENTLAKVSPGKVGALIQFDPYIFSQEESPEAIVHTVIHELLHVATLGKMAQNPALVREWDSLRKHTYEAIAKNPALATEFRERHFTLSYGETNPTEFVSEALSNSELQALLKKIPAPNGTLWSRFVAFVRRLFGLPDSSETMLDRVMSTFERTVGDIPYTREVHSMLAKGGAFEAKMQVFDPATRDKVKEVYNGLVTEHKIVRSAKDRVLEGSSNWLLKALSMRQIADLYAKHFNGALQRYHDSFFARNADSSKMLEEADKISRRWTQLEESNSAEAYTLSKLMRDATMTGIHPDEAFGQGNNDELVPAQYDDWVGLNSEWNSLSPQAQALYNDVRDFYKKETKQQVRLMLLNALRASKFAGDKFMLTENDLENLDEASATEWIEEYVGFNRDRAEAEIDKAWKQVEEDRETGKIAGPTLRAARARVERMQDDMDNTVEEITLLSRMARLPTKQKGPYFPLMRFGEYAVRASKVAESHNFGSAAERAAFMKNKQLEEPTAQFAFPEGEGFPLDVLDVDFRLFESQSAAQEARKQMIAEYGEAAVSPVQLKRDAFKGDATISSNRALQTLLGKLQGNAAAQAAIREFYLQSLNDSSFRKREIRRKNIKGVEAGVQHRTFGNYAKSSAYYIAQLRHGHVMATAKADMQKAMEAHRDESEITALRMSQIVREINTRDEQAADLNEVRPNIRKAVELGQLMLLFTPSYWMINATQPYMMALPWLAGHAPTSEALGALKNAQALIIDPLLKQAGKSWGGMRAYANKMIAEESFTVLEKVIAQIKSSGRPDASELVSMLEQLRRESIIDLSFVAELRDIAAGEGKSQWDRVMDASRVMAHLTEVNNRIMVAIAAYEVAGKGKTQWERVEFAKRAVAETQFDYSASNKPRLFSANDAAWKPLVFQFMQYVQHTYYLLLTNAHKAIKGATPEERRVAQRTLVGLLLTHLAAGGMVGATVQPIKWAIGLMMMLFGLGDDEDRTIKNVLAGNTYDRMIADVTSELFGTNKFSEVLRAGLPRAAGFDLSSRIELGRLYMVDLDPKSAETLFGSALMSFGGPMFGMGANFYEGAKQIQAGDYAKGFERFLPKIGKDAFKTFRLANEGMTDYTGKVILDAKDMSPLSLFATSMGFTPAEVAETYALSGAVNDAKYYIDEQRARITRQYNRAKNADDLNEVMKEMAEFNRKHPGRRITVSDLLQSRRRFNRAELSKQRFGADLRRSEQDLAEEGESYNVE